MPSPAISIRNLGKRYRVNHAVERAPYRTLRDSLARAAQAPWRRLRGDTNGVSEEFWALKDVDFEVQPGEVVGIIGRNGAGKSTLLKILSRITTPTIGEVTINGRVGSLLEVGTGFHPELTGRENVYLNGSILGMTRNEIKSKFDAIAAFSGVEQFLDVPTKRYSSGMQVRLAFSVAAHLQPEIMIVDEVLAVGDADFQQKCLGALGYLGATGRTVLLVSHNMQAIRRLTRSAILLDHGRVRAAGPTGQLISLYLQGSSARSAAWAAPRSDRRKSVQFESISFITASADAPGMVNADEPFEIHMRFTVHVASQIQVAFRVNTNADGESIFTTAHSDESGHGSSFFSKGQYHARCVIPGHLLRPGDYHLFVAANNPVGPTFDIVERALTFTVTDAGSLVSHDARWGYFAPLLNWNISRD